MCVDADCLWVCMDFFFNFHHCRCRRCGWRYYYYYCINKWCFFFFFFLCFMFIAPAPCYTHARTNTRIYSRTFHNNQLDKTYLLVYLCVFRNVFGSVLIVNENKCNYAYQKWFWMLYTSISCYCGCITFLCMSMNHRWWWRLWWIDYCGTTLLSTDSTLAHDKNACNCFRFQICCF